MVENALGSLYANYSPNQLEKASLLISIYQFMIK